MNIDGIAEKDLTIEIAKETPRAARFSIRTKDARYQERESRVLFEGGLLIAALLIGLLVRVFAFEGTIITSGSMKPLLQRGDYALTDHRATRRSSWKRGDVILFIAPPSWDARGATLVKRVIGLPGETVEIREGVVFLNGKKLDEPYRAPNGNDEMLPSTQLKKGEYYVMGDNRNESDDSRENGPISESDIRGQLTVQLWPPQKIGRLNPR